MAVKATNDFETEMAERFGGGGKDAAAEVPQRRPVCPTVHSRSHSRYQCLLRADLRCDAV